MPFGPESFDLIVCQAAFKNFRQPVAALDEMHRVLRRGGTSVIQDLRRDALKADIDQEVRSQGLGGPSGFITRQILGGLRRRAYPASTFQRLIGESLFRSGEIQAEGIGIEVRLEKV